MKSVPRSSRAILFLLTLPCALIAQDPADPPARVGRISSLLGKVSFQAVGIPDWSVATLNYTVTSGDRLLTNQQARAEIEVGPFAVRLADSTDLNVVNLTDNFAQLGLSQGTLRVSVYRMARDDSMEVDTPNGALIIRSPGRYRIDVPQNGNSTLVSVDDGKLELSGPGLDQILTRGQAVELTGSNPIRAAFAQRPVDADFDEWSTYRDRREELSDCSRYVNRDTPGCADLNDYGRWESHATYGHVWYPKRVAVGWVPYRYGHWAWSGPWGWTWIEDQPWGFAPFHYGRWVMVGAVWAWAPGPIITRPCYAPALVAFIDGPRFGFGIHAWFPLGYGEPYYPRYRHSDRYWRQVNVIPVKRYASKPDPDRVRYTNRPRATTVGTPENFPSGRTASRTAASVRPEQLDRAPIARSRWEIPTRTATPAGPRETSVFLEPRPRLVTAGRRPESSAEAEPMRSGSREAEMRPRSPLVTRNAPPLDGGRVATRPRQPDDQAAIRSRPTTDEPFGSRPAETRYPVRRSEPSGQRPTLEMPERTRRSTMERAPEARQTEPARSSGRTATSRPEPQAQSRAPQPVQSRARPPLARRP